MALYTPAARAPGVAEVLDIQQALWRGGLMRGAGSIDVMIAAYAITNDLTILTADRDFEHRTSARRWSASPRIRRGVGLEAGTGAATCRRFRQARDGAVPAPGPVSVATHEDRLWVRDADNHQPQ
nr:hypothetical protein [Agrococcus sp. REN33]